MYPWSPAGGVLKLCLRYKSDNFVPVRLPKIVCITNFLLANSSINHGYCWVKNGFTLMVYGGFQSIDSKCQPVCSNIHGVCSSCFHTKFQRFIVHGGLVGRRDPFLDNSIKVCFSIPSDRFSRASPFCSSSTSQKLRNLFM